MLDKHTIKEILHKIVEGSIRESNGNLQFRCVLCGDSKKSKAKKRGWVLFDSDKITYHCFNCNTSISFKKFLKDNYSSLYTQYFKNKDVKAVLQLSKQDIKIAPKITKTEMVDITDEYIGNSFDIYEKNLEKNKMMLQYTALKYAIDRKLPKDFVRNMRVCYDGKFKDRLLIPYYNHDGEIYCFQGRSLTGREPKYLTNKPDNNTKIFNYYTADPKHLVFIMEGPIDALFINNSIATSGIANYGTEQYEEIIKKFPFRTWVFDNDPTGIDMAIKYAQKGEYVFCWKKEFDAKDINEYVVKNNLTEQELYSIINDNTFTRFRASIKLKMLEKNHA